MLFQSAASIGFALALPAIILMYMLKRTYTEREIASHLLWRQALREQESNRPWQKLRRSLLLLLQLLAAALLVLALMQPYRIGVKSAGLPAVIVLDASASMTAAASGGSGAGDALEEAKSAILDWLHTRSGEGPVTLIAAGREPELLLSGDTGGMRAVEAALTSVKPSYGRADMEAALSLADAVMRDAADTQLVVATDGRWTIPAQTAPMSRAVRLTVGAEEGNTAIAAFVLEPRENGRFAAAVTLVHAGGSPVDGMIVVTPAGSGQAAVSQAFSMRPGEQRVITIDDLPPAEYYRADLTAGDRYTADNTAYTFPVSSGRARALLVGSGNLFLDKALQLAGVETVLADPETYEPDAASFDSIDWVVLDGTDAEQLTSPSWRRMLAGKPVWSIRSPESLPADRVKQPDNSRVEIIPHPVTQYVTLSDTHIARIAAGNPGPELEPIVIYGGLPVMYAGMVNGFPHLVMSFDLRDSDLPLRTDFPIMIAQAAEWLSSGLSPNLGRAEAGDRIDAVLRAGTVRAQWEAVERTQTLLDPTAGPHIREAERAAGGAVSAVQAVPDVPGLYRYVEYGEDGGRLAARLLAVHAAPEEGLSFALSERAASWEAEQQGNGRQDAEAADEHEAASEDGSRTSLIPWVAALLLLLLAAEWEVYRRGIAR